MLSNCDVNERNEKLQRYNYWKSQNCKSEEHRANPFAVWDYDDNGNVIRVVNLKLTPDEHSELTNMLLQYSYTHGRTSIQGQLIYKLTGRHV